MEVKFLSKVVRIEIAAGLIIYIFFVAGQDLYILIHFGHQFGAKVTHILLFLLFHVFGCVLALARNFQWLFLLDFIFVLFHNHRVGPLINVGLVGQQFIERNIISLPQLGDDRLPHFLHELVSSLNFIQLPPGYSTSKPRYLWMKLYHLYLSTYSQGVKHVPLNEVASKIKMPWTGSLQIMPTWSYSEFRTSRCSLAQNKLPLNRMMSPVWQCSANYVTGLQRSYHIQFRTFSNSVSLRSCMWNYLPKLPSIIDDRDCSSFSAAWLSSVVFQNLSWNLSHTLSTNEDLSLSSLRILASTVLKLKWQRISPLTLMESYLNSDKWTATGSESNVDPLQQE